MAGRASADNVLSDTENVGGTPGSIDGSLPAIPPTQVTIRSNPLREYIAGNAYQFYMNMPRALPWAYDDIEQDFGQDIYSRMLLDSQCISTINTLKAGVMDAGISLSSAVQDKADERYQNAADMLERVETMFTDLNQSIDATLWNMLDALSLGNKVGELVFDFETAPSGAQQYTLSKIAVRPRQATAFVVDAHMNVLGLLGRIPGQPLGVQAGMLLTDVQHLPNLLPRSKFAVLTNRPVDDDPRGTSLLRPAFSPWQAKVEMQREFVKYLSQFAVPSVIAHSAPQAQSVQATNADGTLQYDAFNNPVMITPEEALFLGVQSLRNGSVLVLPSGAEVDLAFSNGDGSAFLNAFQMYNAEIAKAITNQTLATEQAEHQARAASATHKDVLDSTTRQLQPPATRVISHDVLGTWALLNGYDVSLLPKVSLSATEGEDRAALMLGYAAMSRAGLLDASQYAGIDEQVSAPKRAVPNESTIAKTESIQVKEDAGSVSPPDDGEDAQPTSPDGETA